MKTQIKKLNFVILLIGLVILTSCSNNITAVSVARINMIQRTIPSLAITATKYTGNKISKYFKNSSASKNKNGATSKKMEKARHNRKLMPITIGVTGARLVSSNSRYANNANNANKKSSCYNV